MMPAKASIRATTPLADDKRPMLEVKLSVNLASPAENVWGLVGNFNGLPEWHPWVRASVLESAAGSVGRRVTIVGGTTEPRELREKLLAYDSSLHKYAYTVIAGQTPFIDYVGRLRVLPTGPERCVVEFHGRFRVAPPNSSADETRPRIVGY